MSEVVVLEESTMRSDSYYAEIRRLMDERPRDRAIRVDRATLQGVVEEMRWAASRVVVLEAAVRGYELERVPEPKPGRLRSLWARVRGWWA